MITEPNAKRTVKANIDEEDFTAIKETVDIVASDLPIQGGRVLQELTPNSILLKGMSRYLTYAEGDGSSLGRKGQTYRDSRGYMTIGIGLRLQGIPTAKLILDAMNERFPGLDLNYDNLIQAEGRPEQPLTDEQMQYMLYLTLVGVKGYPGHTAILQRALSKPDLSNKYFKLQHIIALQSLVYNGGEQMIGEGLEAALKEEDFNKAITEIVELSNRPYDKHTGQPKPDANGIQNRRMLEANLFSFPAMASLTWRQFGRIRDAFRELGDTLRPINGKPIRAISYTDAQDNFVGNDKFPIIEPGTKPYLSDFVCFGTKNPDELKFSPLIGGPVIFGGGGKDAIYFDYLTPDTNGSENETPDVYARYPYLAGNEGYDRFELGYNTGHMLIYDADRLGKITHDGETLEGLVLDGKLETSKRTYKITVDPVLDWTIITWDDQNNAITIPNFDEGIFNILPAKRNIPFRNLEPTYHGLILANGNIAYIYPNSATYRDQPYVKIYQQNGEFINSYKLPQKSMWPRAMAPVALEDGSFVIYNYIAKDFTFFGKSELWKITCTEAGIEEATLLDTIVCNSEHCHLQISATATDENDSIVATSFVEDISPTEQIITVYYDGNKKVIDRIPIETITAIGVYVVGKLNDGGFAITYPRNRKSYVLHFCDANAEIMNTISYDGTISEPISVLPLEEDYFTAWIDLKNGTIVSKIFDKSGEKLHDLVVTDYFRPKMEFKAKAVQLKNNNILLSWFEGVELGEKQLITYSVIINQINQMVGSTFTSPGYLLDNSMLSNGDSLLLAVVNLEFTDISIEYFKTKNIQKAYHDINPPPKPIDSFISSASHLNPFAIFNKIYNFIEEFYSSFVKAINLLSERDNDKKQLKATYFWQDDNGKLMGVHMGIITDLPDGTGREQTSAAALASGNVVLTRKEQPKWNLTEIYTVGLKSLSDQIITKKSFISPCSVRRGYLLIESRNHQVIPSGTTYNIWYSCYREYSTLEDYDLTVYRYLYVDTFGIRDKCLALGPGYIMESCYATEIVKDGAPFYSVKGKCLKEEPEVPSPCKDRIFNFTHADYVVPGGYILRVISEPASYAILLAGGKQIGHKIDLPPGRMYPGSLLTNGDTLLIYSRSYGGYEYVYIDTSVLSLRDKPAEDKSASNDNKPLFSSSASSIHSSSLFSRLLNHAEHTVQSLIVSPAVAQEENTHVNENTELYGTINFGNTDVNGLTAFYAVVGHAVKQGAANIYQWWFGRNNEQRGIIKDEALAIEIKNFEKQLEKLKYQLKGLKPAIQNLNDNQLQWISNLLFTVDDMDNDIQLLKSKGKATDEQLTTLADSLNITAQDIVSLKTNIKQTNINWAVGLFKPSHDVCPKGSQFLSPVNLSEQSRIKENKRLSLNG